MFINIDEELLQQLQDCCFDNTILINNFIVNSIRKALSEDNVELLIKKI